VKLTSFWKKNVNSANVFAFDAFMGIVLAVFAGAGCVRNAIGDVVAVDDAPRAFVEWGDFVLPGCESRASAFVSLVLHASVHRLASLLMDVFFDNREITLQTFVLTVPSAEQNSKLTSSTFQ
jgi:hypothetical protein